MRTKSRNGELNKYAIWLKKNKAATFEEFNQATEGTKSAYYYARFRLGITRKTPKLSMAMKASHARRASLDGSITSVGLPKAVKAKSETHDFMWYELSLLQTDLNDSMAKLKYIMQMTANREVDSKKLIQTLLQENNMLRIDNEQLRKEVRDLTEMVNGPSV
jgi:hypothetical protein